MEELTLQDLDQQPQQEQALIEVVQLPVIVEHLHRLKDETEERVREANSLVCCPDTLTAVKKVRAELNQQFNEMEEARKHIKAAVLEPYEKFEAVYKECVSGPLKTADSVLKSKIDETEAAIINACREEMRAYYDEMAAAYHIDWLPFERMGLRISMADAKSKRHQKPREAVAAYLTKVAQEVKAINQLDYSTEILAEYQKTLDMAGAVDAVNKQHEAVRAAKLAQERLKAQEAADQAAAEKVDAVAPPAAAPHVAAPAPVPTAAPAATPAADAQPLKEFKLRFALTATKPKLIQFKADLIKYCEERGIKYE